ncbi:MAG: preprotein translocase subunit SecG [Alphaproteobacteria bacterium]
MENVVLVIHLLFALSIIGLVLLQRSEGGGLGIGGGGMGKLASPKGAASAMSRATAICAGCFFATSLVLGIMAGTHSGGGKSILDSLDQSPPAAEATLPSPDALDTTPDSPQQIPAAPISE